MLVETKTFDNKYYVGRSTREVPEIDSLIYMPIIEKELEGKFIKAKITDVQGYDLIGEII